MSKGLNVLHYLKEEFPELKPESRPVIFMSNDFLCDFLGGDHHGGVTKQITMFCADNKESKNNIREFALNVKKELELLSYIRRNDLKGH